MNFFDPFAFVRSATIKKELSWRNSVSVYKLEHAGTGNSIALLGLVEVQGTALRSAAICSVVVPQQPPTMLAPNSSIKRRIASEKSSARSGYSVRPSTRIGNPALGITENGRFQCLAMCARCGVISVGPVAQFNPSEAIGKGRRALTTALISDPKSIVPVVSIVTETRIGISRTVFPAASSASKHAVTAHLICKRSWHVSIMKQSAPPSIKPRACSR